MVQDGDGLQEAGRGDTFSKGMLCFLNQEVGIWMGHSLFCGNYNMTEYVWNVRNVSFF